MENALALGRNLGRGRNHSVVMVFPPEPMRKLAAADDRRSTRAGDRVVQMVSSPPCGNVCFPLISTFTASPDAEYDTWNPTPLSFAGLFFRGPAHLLQRRV